MDPLYLLLIGLLAVVGTMLLGRWHPFLALLSGAFLVALLTPASTRFNDSLRSSANVLERYREDGTFELQDGSQSLPSGEYVWWRVNEAGTLHRVGQMYVPFERPAKELDEELDDANRKSASRLQVIERVDEAHGPAPGDLLVTPVQLRAAERHAAESSAARIAAGFGATARNIGIVIALAAVIGACLLASGAAERIVSTFRRLMGESHAALALVLSGFVIGIPVYFDTVFYLLLPIARTLARQTGRNYLLYVLSIIIGATMSHSLVPPTPGPLLVAAELNVDVGTMMQAGIVVGSIAVASGYLFALWANRRWTIPLRQTTDSVAGHDPRPADAVPATDGPPLVWSLAPILLPVILLSLGTLVQANQDRVAPWLADQSPVVAGIEFLSDKHVALGLAVVLAMGAMIVYAPPVIDRARVVQDAVTSAGSIVLITSAGGAFGEVLRQSGIANAIHARFSVTAGGLMLLVIAFLVTAIVRIAQGSATVAMITAVGIVSPLVHAAALPYHPVYVALAIGCGSKPIPWMNDSGFWVITRMSGMTEAESLRTFSLVLTLMGFVGLLATLAGAILVPMSLES